MRRNNRILTPLVAESKAYKQYKLIVRYKDGIVDIKNAKTFIDNKIRGGGYITDQEKAIAVCVPEMSDSLKRECKLCRGQEQLYARPSKEYL